jgi:hypothetical protein
VVEGAVLAVVMTIRIVRERTIRRGVRNELGKKGSEG